MDQNWLKVNIGKETLIEQKGIPGIMDPTEKDQGLEELLNYWSGSAPQENVETAMLTEIETPTSFLVPPTSTEPSSSLLLPPVTSPLLLPTPEFWTQPPTMSENTFNQNSLTQESQGLPDFSVTWTAPLSSATSTSYSPPPGLTCPPSSPTFTSPISFSPLSEGRTTPYSRPPQSTTQRRLSLQESEEEKTRKRRARNREAAARCREKRRAHEVELGRRESRLEEEGRRLGEELARLGEEKRHLVSLLALHRQLFLNREGRAV